MIMMNSERPDAQALLHECRDMMTRHMRSSVSRMISHVEDTLFELASREKGSMKASNYIDAVREVRLKKQEIQVRFENRFIALFENDLKRFAPSRDYAVEGLHIEDDHWLNTSTTERQALGDVVTVIRDECRTVLSALDKKVSLLLNDVGTDEIHNPLQPESVIEAFWESCRDIKAGTEIRLLLVQLLERHIASELHVLYDELDLYLTTQDAYLKTVKDITEKNAEVPAGESEEVSKRERRSLMVRYWVSEKLERKLRGKNIPDFIEDFLRGHWLILLERIYKKHGEDSTEWTRAMHVVDDLILSSHPTMDFQERRRQIWVLPGLIYHLKAGMQSLPLSLKEQADFLSQLKSHHVKVTYAAPATGGTYASSKKYN